MPATATPQGRRARGSCMEDCIAFLFELREGRPPEELPDLWAGGPHEWKAVLASWVRERTGRPLRCFPGRPGRRPSIEVGWSPRDPLRVRHAVVVDAQGRLLHDPHPDGRGVVRPDRWWWW